MIATLAWFHFFNFVFEIFFVGLINIPAKFKCLKVSTSPGPWDRTIPSIWCHSKVSYCIGVPSRNSWKWHTPTTNIIFATLSWSQCVMSRIEKVESRFEMGKRFSQDSQIFCIGWKDWSKCRTIPSNMTGSIIIIFQSLCNESWIKSTRISTKKWTHIGFSTDKRMFMSVCLNRDQQTIQNSFEFF